jgi:hypothetical protein
MGLSRRTRIAIACFIALMAVLTVATLIALVVNANSAGISPAATSAGVSRCLTAELVARPGQGGVAAGSVGDVVHFTNVSHHRCTLHGYPGLQMLNAAGRPIVTDVHRGSSVTVSARPVGLVTLAPGGKASFELGYADATGFGSETCPTSTRIEITPPNDYRPLTIAWRIQPFGGDIPHLRCGEITVSPVYAGASSA